MGYDVGIAGMWGFPLNGYWIGERLADHLTEEREHIQQVAWGWHHDNPVLEPAFDDLEDYQLIDRLAEEMEPYVRTALLREHGVILPPQAWIEFVGDDMPGRMAIEPNSFVIGVGLRLPPWEWRLDEVHESFKAKAEFIEWAWGG